MSLLSSYLSSRKQRNIHSLLERHVGRCKAVAATLRKISREWAQGEAESAKINTEIIQSEEKSADHLEKELIKEVGKSNVPTDTLKKGLVKFVRMVDTSAGGAKRAALNMLLLVDYPLPDKYAKIVDNSSIVIEKIFARIEEAINNLDDVDKVDELTKDVDKLEDDMDDYYVQLKAGYFEIENSFESAAGLIILDHVTRDLEHAADTGEDAMDLLLELSQHR